MKKKLKAYTLFEVIISMVIMSVISLIVFVLFSSFLKQLNIYNETNTKLSTYAFLKNNLKREFYISKNVKSLTNGIEIEMNDSLNIYYTFRDEYIVKKMSNHIDTIFIKLEQIEQITTYNQSIRQLNLDFLIFEEPLTLVLNKEYGTKFNINKTK